MLVPGPGVLEEPYPKPSATGNRRFAALLPLFRRTATGSGHDRLAANANPNRSSREAAAPQQEGTMSNAVPSQHPAVVLRSHYMHVRALLTIAAVAIVVLAIAVVVLATANGPTATIASTAPSISAPPQTAITRYDGGPDEGTRGPGAVLRSATIRYDGGPEEGTRSPAR
jgi:hypothetical protein